MAGKIHWTSRAAGREVSGDHVDPKTGRSIPRTKDHPVCGSPVALPVPVTDDPAEVTCKKCRQVWIVQQEAAGLIDWPIPAASEDAMGLSKRQLKRIRQWARKAGPDEKGYQLFMTLDGQGDFYLVDLCDELEATQDRLVKLEQEVIVLRGVVDKLWIEK